MPLMDALGARLAAAGVSALTVTGAGWVAGVAACVAVATSTGALGWSSGC